MIALALATSPLAAHADEITYTYIETGYAHVDLEGETGDGYQLRGSVAVSSSFYAFGQHSSVDADGGGVEFDENQVGLGFHTSVSERADFIAEVGYVDQDVVVYFPGGAASAADGGARASVGFRGLFTRDLEWWVKGSYKDGGDFTGSLSGLAGLQYRFNPMWGIFGEIETGELVEDAYSTKYMIGVRASF